MLRPQHLVFSCSHPEQLERADGSIEPPLLVWRCLKITPVPPQNKNIVTKPAAQNLNSASEYLRIESGFSLLYGVYWRKPNASPMFSPFSTTLLSICVRPELDHALSVRGRAEDGGDPGSHCLHSHYAVRSQMPAHWKLANFFHLQDCSTTPRRVFQLKVSQWHCSALK